VLRVPLQDSYQIMQGRLLRRWQHFDAAFVPGYAANLYAQAIGFASDRIFQGLYTCDTSLYCPIGQSRHQDGAAIMPPVFLYVGQLIKRKGIHTLLQAYQDYRRQVEKPWELWCVGQGPLQSLLENQPGIRLIEFTPPDQCAQLMAQAGTFVIASEWDHWGVVLHEAACAGLPLIASRQCRATVELLQDGFNGYTFDAGDAARLSQLLLQCSTQPDLAGWGANSLKLAGRLSPEIFAWQLRQNIPAALGHIQ
jgi:glycosyltransferase involved in cell wall biosynthesis